MGVVIGPKTCSVLDSIYCGDLFVVEMMQAKIAPRNSQGEDEEQEVVRTGRPSATDAIPLNGV